MVHQSYRQSRVSQLHHDDNGKGPPLSWTHPGSPCGYIMLALDHASCESSLRRPHGIDPGSGFLRFMNQETLKRMRSQTGSLEMRAGCSTSVPFHTTGSLEHLHSNTHQPNSSIISFQSCWLTNPTMGYESKTLANIKVAGTWILILWSNARS